MCSRAFLSESFTCSASTVEDAFLPCSSTSRGQKSTRIRVVRASGRSSSQDGRDTNDEKRSKPSSASSESLSATRYRSKFESLYAFDKSFPEQKIEKPDGLSKLSPIVHFVEIGAERSPPCENCDALGSVECTTCSTSGLYVDPVLESQGVIVKVRCLGCGGSGAVLCSKCGGRGFIQASETLSVSKGV